MKQIRISRAKWQQRIRSLEASGLSVAAYSRKHGISPQTLSWWRWKLRGSGAASRRKPKRAAEFFELPPVSLESGAAQRDRIELQLGDATLRIPAEFDEQSLARVLGVVRGAR